MTVTMRTGSSGARSVRRARSIEEIIGDELRNIAAYNRRLNAFTEVFGDGDGNALRTARECATPRRSGAKGRLLGVPISVKDNIFVSASRTTAACGAFSEFVPNVNADVVDAFIRAGGIIVGKTNMHELALGVTSTSSCFGPVRNPRDHSRIAGGSSGGSAVSVAMSENGMISLGTDTGGSVRIPAALCGVCGFKPSINTISTQGIFPLSATLDHVGVIAKTVPEVATAFGAIAGELARQPKRREREGDRRVRLGIPEAYFLEEMDKPVAHAYWRCVHKIEAADGFSLVRGIRLADHSRFSQVRLAIQLTEAAWFYRELISDGRMRRLVHPDVLGFLDTGARIGMSKYMLSTVSRLRIIREMSAAFRPIDILITPTCSVVAPKVEDVIGNESSRVRPLLLRNTQPFNLSGYPALTIPSSAETASLPVGIQLVGTYGDDHRVLSVGQRIANLLHQSE